MDFPEGWGGPLCEPILENPEGMGGHRKNPFHGGYGNFLELHIVHSSLVTNQTGTIFLAQHE